MNAWIESINFSIAGAALLLSVLGLWITAVVPGIDRWSKRFFISYFLIFMLCCLSSIVEAAAQYYIVTGPAFYFLLKWVSASKLRAFLEMSRNLTPIYLIHWCILGFIDSIFCYLLEITFSWPVVYGIGAALIVLSVWLAKRWVNRKQIKKAI